MAFIIVRAIALTTLAPYTLSHSLLHTYYGLLLTNPAKGGICSSSLLVGRSVVGSRDDDSRRSWECPSSSSPGHIFYQQAFSHPFHFVLQAQPLSKEAKLDEATIVVVSYYCCGT
mmetsp:Transcript_31015/g.57396  ORF Transcript_31015/g.57396 Transcript_31015/m.57396 type:complete len:115 (+) Transcript_31015:181-525(+)